TQTRYECYYNAESLCRSNHPPPTEAYTLSLHDALPISKRKNDRKRHYKPFPERNVNIENIQARNIFPVIQIPSMHHARWRRLLRSEEHTSELQSRFDLVCRLLLEKKKTSIDESYSISQR